MTLDEKIGQMTQIQLDILGENGPDGFRLVQAKLDTIFGVYKVGSILNAPYSYCLDAEAWNVVIPQIQEASMKYMGIPCIYGLDQNHGTTYTNGGTLFPQNLNVAASFNTEIARRLRKSRLMRPARATAPGLSRRLSTWPATPAGRASGKTTVKIRWSTP